MIPRRARESKRHTGKCIACDACVRIAVADNEPLGFTMGGRGFDVSVAVPFDLPLSEGLIKTARCCAEACPSGALALRSPRSCDTCRLAGPQAGA